MSDGTAKRILVYFLVDLDVIEPATAAEYLIMARLKSGTLYEISEDIKELKKRQKSIKLL